MNWRRTAATAALALVVLLCMTGCPAKPPMTPAAPWGAESTWTGASYTCSVTTTVPKGGIRYVMDWTNGTDTTDEEYASGETVAVRHAWDAAGTYDVKAQAVLGSDPAKASEFSPAKSVKVILNIAPVVESVDVPTVAVIDAATRFTVYGFDAEEDSMRVVVDWGRGSPTDTGYFLSPCAATISHVFGTVGTDTALFYLEDWKGTRSAPFAAEIKVGKEGGVKWAWFNDDVNRDPLTTSALVVDDGTSEVVMGCCDDGRFYSIRASTGNDKANAGPKDNENSLFVSHPAAANGRVIVSSDECELYALSLSNLGKAWQYPDSAIGKAPPYPFGTPAISGADIYVFYDDSLQHLAHFQDAGVSVNPLPSYILGANLIDAPVVDASGNVIFGTDSGYVYSMPSDLSSPNWRRHLIPIGDVNAPIIGDGTIYCGSDSFYLYALSLDSGAVLWAAPLDGVGARPALGASALFVGTERGTIYSIDPSTGTINWQKAYGAGFGYNTTPVVAANGYVYFQNDDDVLICVNQADGTLIWSCDCKEYLGGGRASKPRKLESDDSPSPSITSTGNIIVIGTEAVYCVAGYETGPLDPTAAWPKWQRDLSNTGKR